METGNFQTENTASNRPVAVDLGLPSGTLWADRNLGADIPEACGDYFRFGEVVPFVQESDDSHLDKLPKDIAGTAYDAATTILGEEWAIPTKGKIKELRRYCKMELLVNNNIFKGARFTGRNGNSIFLPSTGLKHDFGEMSHMGYGEYWMSNQDIIGQGFGFNFKEFHFGYFYRYTGMQIRPVHANGNGYARITRIE